MTDSELFVLARVDLDGRHLRLIATGPLTGADQQGLHPVIEPARTRTPAAEVLVDLGACTPLEPVAVELLRAGIDQGRRSRLGGTVEPVLPEPAATTVRTHRAEAIVPTGEPLAGCAGRGAR